MDSIKIDLLIEQIIQEEILNETSYRDGFNVNKLKSLAKNDIFGPDVWKYVEDLGLEQLGRGSARTVFLISPKKVLKVGRGQRGYAQNEAEVEVATNPATKNIITKIFDYDPKYQWLISEFVREFREHEKPKFERLAGFDFDLLLNFISELDSFEDVNHIFDFLESMYTSTINSQWSSDPQKNVCNKKRKQLKSKEFITFAINLYNIFKSSNLLAGDLLSISHWGQTGDGRVVLLDYGYTFEVADKYY